MRRGKIITALCTRWQVRLNLQSWDVRWRWQDTPDDDAAGNVCTSRWWESAEVRIAKRLPWDKVRETVVHEMVHIRTDRALSAYRNMKESHVLPAGMIDFLDEGLMHEWENSTYQLTRTLMSVGEWADRDLEAKWEKRHARRR